jgi:hypothetical protein
MAARLEKLLVETYTTARTLATQGRLGALVPPAVATLVNTAVGHHQAHMDAWNKVLTGAGRPAATDADQQLRPTVEAAVARLADIPAVATLGLRLEDYASQTYLRALPTLRSPEVVDLAARILVVDEQHQAVLRSLLGLYPVGSGVSRDSVDFAPADPGPSLITG